MKRFRFWNMILAIGLAIVAFTATSCLRTSTDEGPKVTYNIKTRPFTKFEFSAVGDVVIRQGKDYSVKITTYEKQYKHIRTVWTKDSVLEISYVGEDGKTSNIKGLRALKASNTSVEITVPSLNNIYFNGIGELNMDTPYKANNMVLELNGIISAKIRKVIANNFTANVEGISRLSVDTLTAKKSYLEVEGICKASCFFVKSGEAEVSTDGICKTNLLGTLKQAPIIDKDGITHVSDDTERW